MNAILYNMSQLRSEITKELFRRGIYDGVIFGGFTNKHHSEKTKKTIGLKNSISQKGEKNSQYGKHWITNGIESKLISKDDIPEKWYLGRKQKPK